MNNLKSVVHVASRLWIRGKWAAPAIMLLSASLLLAQDPPAPAQDQVFAEPSTPEHMPARPPRVSNQNGKLTIDADNSTIADILNKVHEETGATVEMPPSAGTERVVVHIGPASARDVLSTLLYGMPFNYVIEGSDANPLDVQSVVLTPRTGGTSTASNHGMPVPAAPRMAYNQAPEQSSDEEGSAKQVLSAVENEASQVGRGGINMSNDERAAAQAAAMAAASAAISGAPSPLSVPPDGSNGPNGSDANGNTPKVNEQISNTMFHMFQQRAQMQAQENQRRQQPQQQVPPPVPPPD